MDKVKQQIAMKLQVSYHDILDYSFDFACANRLESMLKVTVVGPYSGMDSKFANLKKMANSSPSIKSIVANAMDQSPIISISVEMYLLVGDKFTLLVTKALHKTFKDSHEQYKARIKQRGNAATSRLAKRPS